MASPLLKNVSLSSLKDGLINVLSGLGTSRDKAANSQYQTTLLTDQQLLEIYRSSWIARKIVDVPALDATRKWRDWQAEGDQIELIEEVEKALLLRQKVHRAITSARLFGGAALYIGVKDGNTELPLMPERIGKGGLRYVTMLHRRQLSPGPDVMDPESEFFGRPEYYTLNTVSTNSVRIHASRFALFYGADQVDDVYATSLNKGFGDSVLLAAYDAVKNLDSASGNVASLIYEAKVDTIGIPGLMSKLGNASYEKRLMDRLTLAEIGKGINGSLVHDSEEIIGQKSASFGSLPELLDRYMTLCAGAADIPMTRLLGQSPGGLSATGESDIRNYYDRVSAIQELEIGPEMRRLEECLIRSAIGSRPEEVHYRWSSLWQITDKERAEIGKIQADMINVLRSTQLIPDQPLAVAAVTAITESGALPGLEGAVTAYFEENPDEELGVPPEGEDPEADPMAEEDPPEEDPAKPAADSALKTLYVSRSVLNADEIRVWAKGQGFKTALADGDMHVTIAFSRSPVDWMKVGESWSGKIELPEGGPRMVEKFGTATVLLFASSELQWRHQSILEAGASWDHDGYNPHITISWDESSPDPANIVPYQGRIILGPEVFKEVKEDWKSGIVEDAEHPLEVGL